MNNCTHPQIVLHPKNIRAEGDKVVFDQKDIEHGEMSCRKCGEQLPVEDRAMYKHENIFIGVPTKVVERTEPTYVKKRLCKICMRHHEKGVSCNGQ